MSPTCPRCGVHAIRPNARFCGKCGAKLSPPVEVKTIVTGVLGIFLLGLILCAVLMGMAR